MSFLDQDERLVELSEKVELAYSPIADVKEFPTGVDVTLIEGAVGNEEQLELLRQVRRNSKLIVSFGDCAVTGCATALRNTLKDSAESILKREFVENTIEKPLLDYKVHCFSGEPQLVQVDFDRFSNHTRKFYDLNWHAMPFSTLYPISMKDATKPDKFEEMLLFARQLSRDMVYARIDFYVYKGIIYFGEVTLHHGGGFEPFYPRKYDYIIGRKIKLPF